MNTLLIIGGSGFFGKSILDCFSRGLLSKWHINKIIIMSRNPDRLLNDYPELINSDVELFSGDVSTINFLPNAEYVIHAAASTDASRYLSHNEEERNNIIRGTLNYCRLAPKFHKDSRIVFCSSGAVYGYQPKHLKYLEEGMPFGNINRLSDIKKSYAYAKRDSESVIQKLGELGLNASIARCFAFVGKYLPKDQHFAIGNFIADGLAGKDINVKADREVYRSYMYADDLVNWLMTLAENSSTECPIYNVASDHEIEISKLAEIIADLFNVKVNSKAILIKEIDRYIPSIQKAQNELKLTNTFSLKESIMLSIKKT
jgi:nucleoside-diphosphate-sugar epimerase